MRTSTMIRRTASRAGFGALVVAVVILGMGAPAFAAKPSHPGGGNGGGGSHSGGGTSVPTGNDISYPQCGSSYPSAPAFGIVGVNDGLANNLNPCLGTSANYPSYTTSELFWAVSASTGTTAQPKASLYVNTADPGNVYQGTLIGDWPTSGSTPDGTCNTTTVTTTSGTATAGQNSAACAWQYGYDKATQDAAWLTAAANAVDAQGPPVSVSSSPAAYPWWLDVETANTWQSGTSGLAMNVADLEGMVAALDQAGGTSVSVGVYSTASQWDQITGGTPTSSSLSGLPDWIPGAKTLSAAESNCTAGSFTAGAVSLTQFRSHPDDGDYAC